MPAPIECPNCGEWLRASFCACGYELIQPKTIAEKIAPLKALADPPAKMTREERMRKIEEMRAALGGRPKD